jgi:hypothetical protein
MPKLTEQEQQDLIDEFYETTHYDQTEPWTDHVAETEESDDEPDYTEIPAE